MNSQPAPAGYSPTTGPLIAAYSTRPPGWLRRLVLPAAFAAAGILALIAGLWVWNAVYSQYGPAAAQRDAISWYRAGAALLLLALAVALVQWYRAAFQLGIYKFGLALKRPGRRPRILRWEQIHGIATESTAITLTSDPQTTPLQTRHRARLFLRQGRPVQLADFCSPSALPTAITQIKASLYPRLLPDLRVQLRRGEWAPFGPLSIHATRGLATGGRRNNPLPAGQRGPTGNEIPWAAVRRIQVRAGFVVVESTQQADISISVGHIPNLELLLQLIQEEVKNDP